MSRIILGIAGRIGSGKTEVAKYLEESHGFVRDAYAKSLKRAASEAFGVPLTKFYASQAERRELDPYWGISYREMLQRFGTNAMRRTFGGDFWVDALWVNYKDLSALDIDLVIEDVRFPEEAEAVLSRGGAVIEVLRPEAEPEPIPWWKFWEREHPSERPLDDQWVSYRVINDGSIEQLQLTINKILIEEGYCE